MTFIYLLTKIEQVLCDYELKPIRMFELLLVYPLYRLNLNLSSFFLCSILFTLAWMDHQLKEVSDRLIILFYITVFIHYIYHPIPISMINLILCFGLYLFSKLTNGLGIGDVYIFFGLSFILNQNHFITVFKYSLWLALFFELIKKTKTSFALIPYIYLGLILFLILNLY
ncbi:MAG: prepilin peptidase [Erysipelotrichaceae bacterium]|jgi:hypothetical protein